MTEQEKIIFLEKAIDNMTGKKVKLDPSQNLQDLGLDSLDIVEIQMHFEDVTGLSLPDNDEPIYLVDDLLKLMP